MPNAAQVVEHIRKGGRFLVKSYTRPIIVDAKAMVKWEAAGLELFADDGDGLRMRQGKGSVYMMQSHFALID